MKRPRKERVGDLRVRLLAAEQEAARLRQRVDRETRRWWELSDAARHAAVDDLTTQTVLARLIACGLAAMVRLDEAPRTSNLHMATLASLREALKEGADRVAGGGRPTRSERVLEMLEEHERQRLGERGQGRR